MGLLEGERNNIVEHARSLERSAEGCWVGWLAVGWAGWTCWACRLAGHGGFAGLTGIARLAGLGGLAELVGRTMNDDVQYA